MLISLPQRKYRFGIFTADISLYKLYISQQRQKVKTILQVFLAFDLSAQ